MCLSTHIIYGHLKINMPIEQTEKKFKFYLLQNFHSGKTYAIVDEMKQLWIFI